MGIVKSIIELALDVAHDLLDERRAQRQREADAQAQLEDKFRQLGAATAAFKAWLAKQEL